MNTSTPYIASTVRHKQLSIHKWDSKALTTVTAFGPVVKKIVCRMLVYITGDEEPLERNVKREQIVRCWTSSCSRLVQSVQRHSRCLCCRRSRLRHRPPLPRGYRCHHLRPCFQRTDRFVILRATDGTERSTTKVRPMHNQSRQRCHRLPGGERGEPRMARSCRPRTAER